MKFLILLNFVSALYAFLFFVSLELMVNVYRISRLTNWNLETVNTFVFVLIIGLIIIFTFLIWWFITNWLEPKNSAYWTVILWIPYLILYVNIFTSLFPIQNPGEAPNLGVGLLMIGMLFVYPFYIASINLLSLRTEEKSS